MPGLLKDFYMPFAFYGAKTQVFTQFNFLSFLGSFYNFRHSECVNYLRQGFPTKFFGGPPKSQKTFCGPLNYIKMFMFVYTKV